MVTQTCRETRRRRAGREGGSAERKRGPGPGARGRGGAASPTWVAPPPQPRPPTPPPRPPRVNPKELQSALSIQCHMRNYKHDGFSHFMPPDVCRKTALSGSQSQIKMVRKTKKMCSWRVLFNLPPFGYGTRVCKRLLSRRGVRVRACVCVYTCVCMCE